LYLKCI